jgi:hypothetical protein
MSPPQTRTQPDQAHATTPAAGHPSHAQGASPATLAIAHSPRMAAQRQAMRAAFGPAAMPQLQGDGEDAPNLTGMPHPLKSGIEALSGMDMSDVRVHRNSSKPAQLSALAYAQGNDIHLGPGQDGHLGHEAWHVVQQRQGRVQATMQMAGVGVNDDAGLELEADLMGAKASRGEHVQWIGQDPGVQRKSAVIQRAVGFEYETTDWRSALSLDVEAHAKSKEQKAAHSEVDNVLERDREGKLKSDAKSGLNDKQLGRLDAITRDGPDGHVDPRRPHAMTPLQTQDFVNLSATSTKKFMAMKKKDIILRGAGFTMEADEVLGNGFSDVEFVTDPFEETEAGVAEMSRAMLTIVEIVRCLFKLAADRPGAGRLILASELAAFGSPLGNAVFLTPQAPTMSGVMQASAAIRLDQVARVMTEIGGVTAGETEQEKKDRFDGRATLGDKLGSGMGNNPTGDAPGKARNAIVNYGGAHPHIDQDMSDAYDKSHAYMGLGGQPAFGSNALQGLISVMVQYIVTSNQPLAGYAKTIAPLMARTDFATMFGALPPFEQAYFKAGGGAEFATVVGDAVNPIAMNKDIFEKGLYHNDKLANHAMLAGLTRESWAKGITQGVDRLTEKNFPDNPNDGKNYGHEMESLGALGNTTGTVGKAGVNQVNDAPIFEFRGMGSVAFTGLYHRALDVFRYIVGVNQGLAVNFKDTASDFMTTQNNRTKNEVKKSLNVKKAVRAVQATMERDLKAML